jgi:galactosamine-6-phosphate isomerase
MQTIVYKDYEALSEAAAELILELIKKKPHAVLCFASGHTPLLACKLLVKKIQDAPIDITELRWLGLDEWVGVPPQNEGSCHYFLYETMFKPLQLAPRQVHVFDAMAPDLETECKKMNDYIRQCGGIDMMLVGIGMNGHIGFNEPGISFDKYAHVAQLDASTISIGQKYFSSTTVLSKGITIGLKHLQEARQVILMANGIKKSNIIERLIKEPVGVELPATILKKHANSWLLLDEAAASSLHETGLHATQ